jgi:type I restriction enzyme R subunit
VRLYTFLSQVFDYGNTAVEKRAIFCNRLLPLLEFVRDQESVDLSKLVLTRHQLKKQDSRSLPLSKQASLEVTQLPLPEGVLASRARPVTP